MRVSYLPRVHGLLKNMDSYSTEHVRRDSVTIWTCFYVLCMLSIEIVIYVLCMLPIEIAICVLCMLPIEIAINVLCMLPIETAINIAGTLQCLRVCRLLNCF